MILSQTQRAGLKNEVWKYMKFDKQLKLQPLIKRSNPKQENSITLVGNYSLSFLH